MTLYQLAAQALRMTHRDWRAGELRLLAAALVLAVAAVTSVGFFVDRIRLGLQRDARQLLGADLVLNSDRPIEETLRARAASIGVRLADTVTFPSMALNAAHSELNTLVALKAVSRGYPLRGALRVQSDVSAPDEATQEIPAPGTAWVDAQVIAALHLRVGEPLKLGEHPLVVTRLIVTEPDRGIQFINFAPRVLINLADLPATALIQPGSRVSYRLLAAGNDAAMHSFGGWLQDNLQRGQRVESIESGRPEVQRTLERAQRFLALVALLSALVAAVAVAAAARRFSLRHLDSCAMMRCLGLAQRQIFHLFACEFLVIGVAACAIGTLLGLAGHFALLWALRSLLPGDLPTPSMLPAAQGLVCGLVLLLGFALPPLAQLQGVPPLRVLRKDLGVPTARSALGFALGGAAFFLLLLWAANDLRIGLLVAGGFAGGVALFAVVATLALRSLRSLRTISGRLGMSWRFALAALQRRPTSSVIQLTSLAVGLMALLLLTVTRTDLVNAWRRTVPADAPNRFVINIQPDQVAAIRQRLLEAKIAPAPIFPMVRGRLIARNGTPIVPENYADERAQRLVEREFNLSYAETAPSYNTIVAGRWFAPDAAELSLEEGIAKTLGAGLGDELTFDIAGSEIRARVTSLRKVNWDSMRSNFFVIMSPRLLQDQPATFITSVYLPAQETQFASDLVREFPNLTVIDTGAVLRQVQAVLDQVIAAVEFLFAFTLVAGVLVLYTALVSSRDERVHEAGLLRALGATQRQLARAQVAEMICIGGLAGALAALGANTVGWALARYAFDLEVAFSVWIFLLGIAGGAVCAVAGGWIGLRSVLRTPPLATLREA